MSFFVGGVRITIRFFFFAFLAFLSMIADAQMILCSVLFSLLHECGHLAAMLWFDCKPKEICLGAFGMQILREAGIRMSYRQEMLVLLAGPAVNLVCSGTFFLLGTVTATGFYYPAMVNLLLAGFNLLPISGTDGGEALYCALARSLQEKYAHRICIFFSFTLLCVLYTWVFLLTIRGQFPISFFGVLLYLTGLIFLKLPASR
ncbi:MAG TPA: hypothetical protein H9662_08110 [Firmicutes bacterium]|mgnify:FL=1|nr:hypothetical protein [Bacillota bacterium]